MKLHQFGNVMTMVHGPTNFTYIPNQNLITQRPISTAEYSYKASFTLPEI